MQYTLEKVDDRYDKVASIGYCKWDNGIELTDEPFDMSTFHLYRYDKNIGQWVEGEIDEETGEWQLKTE